MDPNVRIMTNNVPRDIIEAWELSVDERAEFDYLDWQAIQEGRDSASFVRYRGQLYDLREFSPDWGITKGSGLPAHLAEWHGYLSESFSSAVLVRFVDDEQVIIGRMVVR